MSLLLALASTSLCLAQFDGGVFMSVGRGTSGSSRNVYFVRHGEAGKNKVDHPDPRDQSLDRLTDLGRQQALNTGGRLAPMRLTAVISAPEQRCRDTALAITMYSALPPASVDGSLTSKAYDSESAEHRASRGTSAVERFIAATLGDVAVVTHGHMIELITSRLLGEKLQGDVLKRELVNAGVKHLRLSAQGKWTLVGSNQTVVDD